MRWLTRIAVIALFLAAATVFWWLDTVRAPAPGPTPALPVERLPDYYFTGFRLQRYLGAGAPRETLTGDRLEHFAGVDAATVARPHLDYQPAGAPAWRIRSERGTLLQATDMLELEGAVRLHRPPAPDVREMTLLTPYLRYDMDGEVARTDREVRVLAPGSRVDATGMTAWLGPDRIELHADVRARHDPALAATGADDG